MRSLFVFSSITLLTILLGWVLPWWSVGAIAFLVVLIMPMRSGRSFLIGLLSGFVSWLVVALVIDARNHHLLSGKMAQLFHLPGSTLFILVTAAVGGILAGLSAWAGSLLSARR